MKLLTVQRRESIKAMLLEKESITVREVMETYDVSVETVRRDFDALAGEGFLNKIYGGATLKKRTSYVPRELSDQIFSEEKERVAARAVRFMKPGDTIYGSFQLCFSDVQGAYGAEYGVHGAHQFAQVLNELSKCPKIRLIAVGGRVLPQTAGLLGPTASGFLQQFQVDRAFFPANLLT
ncbi:MAG: DeoR family transcriptional regulator [Christensenellales bacterium]